MTKMATTPIYGKKNYKNLHLQNQKVDDLGTWYVALGGGGFFWKLWKPWSLFSLDMFNLMAINKFQRSRLTFDLPA